MAEARQLHRGRTNAGERLAGQVGGWCRISAAGDGTVAAGFAIGAGLLGGFAPVTPFGWTDLRPEMLQGKGAATCLRGTRNGTA